MPDPRELLVCLLDYIKEQTKEVDPKGYRLTSSKGFLRKRGDIAGLPGVDFDIRLAGDHVWLRVPRLAAEPPPDPPKSHKGWTSSITNKADTTGLAAKVAGTGGPTGTGGNRLSPWVCDRKR